MTDARAIVCGIDGGGTHTRVRLADANGRAIGTGIAGSGNLHDVGADRLQQHIGDAFGDAWSEAGASAQPVARAFCAMASVGTAANRSAVQRIVAAAGVAPLDHIVVDIDLVGAHAGGLGGGPGIALIAGTGSSAWGRDPKGRTMQSGGWGSLLDDVGSATWLGTRALVAAIRAFDGRGAKTSLERAVVQRFELQHMRELLPRVDEEGLDRAGRAQLARLVTAAAENGDAVASDLLDDGADALAECAEAIWRGLDFGEDSVEVTVTGGLAAGSADYRERVHAAIERRVPRAECVMPRGSNLDGATKLALEWLREGSH